MKPKVTVIITRASIGGAQKYVLSSILELKSQYDFHVIVGSEGYLSTQLGKIDIRVSIIPSINSLNFFKAIWQLRATLKNHKSQLINTHSTLASIYARLANYGLTPPLIYSVHGWFFAENTSFLRHFIGPIIERSLTPLTTHWITETRFDQSLGLTKKTITAPKNSTVIPNAIPKPIKREAPEYIQDKSKINIAFIGRISYQKNPLLAVQVLNSLPSNFNLTLFCDNKKDIEINKAIEEYQLENRIALVDDEKETSEILHHFDLLLMTSRYEGMPLSIIEAMASGLPIVSTDTCGLNELVHDKKNGYLIKKMDPEIFAKRIISIFSNEKLRRSMSEQSRYLFEKNHTLDIMAQRISTIFNKTIK